MPPAVKLLVRQHLNWTGEKEVPLVLSQNQSDSVVQSRYGNLHIRAGNIVRHGQG